MHQTTRSIPSVWGRHVPKPWNSTWWVANKMVIQWNYILLFLPTLNIWWSFLECNKDMADLHCFITLLTYKNLNNVAFCFRNKRRTHSAMFWDRQKMSRVGKIWNHRLIDRLTACNCILARKFSFTRNICSSEEEKVSTWCSNVSKDEILTIWLSFFANCVLL